MLARCAIPLSVSSQYFRFSAVARAGVFARAGMGTVGRAGAGASVGSGTGAELVRSPFLERLLARADGFTPISDWRADAFRIIAPGAASVPAVASVALFADLGARAGSVTAQSVTAGSVTARSVTAGSVMAGSMTAGSGTAGSGTAGSWVCLATPVHYVAEMSNVRLAANGVLSLSPADAEALAADFNRVWVDSGIHLTAGRRGALYGIFDKALEVITRDPADVVDRHIEAYLPLGTDAPRLRKLMSEVEMWSYEHAVNRSRIAQGLQPFSGLWLWGGGPMLTALPPVQGGCAGDDVFFNAFSGERSGPGVVVVPGLPGTADWAHVESSRLEPALKALRSGNIARLDLSAGDKCFRVSAFGSRRFWRRLKPWWEYFE